jgi:hypothetical protein
MWQNSTFRNDSNKTKLHLKRHLSMLHSENACYHSVQINFPSCLLSKSVKIEKYRAIIVHVILYGCEAWSLILRKEHKLKVSEKRVL